MAQAILYGSGPAVGRLTQERMDGGPAAAAQQGIIYGVGIGDTARRDHDSVRVGALLRASLSAACRSAWVAPPETLQVAAEGLT